jgi:hypothetical protein
MELKAQISDMSGILGISVARLANIKWMSRLDEQMPRFKKYI